MAPHHIKKGKSLAQHISSPRSSSVLLCFSSCFSVTCSFLLSSARSAAQEAGSGGRQLDSYPGHLEAAPAGQAARPNQRLPGHLLPAGERRAARPAQHPGHCSARGSGTGWRLRVCGCPLSCPFFSPPLPVALSCSFPIIVLLYCTFFLSIPQVHTSFPLH